MGLILPMLLLEKALIAWFQGREEREKTESQRDVKLYVFIHLFWKGEKRKGDCAQKMSKKDATAGAVFKGESCVCCDT